MLLHLLRFPLLMSSRSHANMCDAGSVQPQCSSSRAQFFPPQIVIFYDVFILNTLVQWVSLLFCPPFMVDRRRCSSSRKEETSADSPKEYGCFLQEFEQNFFTAPRHSAPAASTLHHHSGKLNLCTPKRAMWRSVYEWTNSTFFFEENDQSLWNG